MLKKLLISICLCGFAIYTGDSPNDFDETEDVTDESSSTNDVTAEEIEKVKSAIAKSDNGLAAVAAAAHAASAAAAVTAQAACSESFQVRALRFHQQSAQ